MIDAVFCSVLLQQLHFSDFTLSVLRKVYNEHSMCSWLLMDTDKLSCI